MAGQDRVLCKNVIHFSNLDLLNIIMLELARELPEHDETYEWHRLLGALLSRELTIDEKLNIIGNEYDILIVDESFLDFADTENMSLLSEETLGKDPNLYVVKSISKSYGVPGLRLGILASGNAELIGKWKKRVSIWNINSQANYFMCELRGGCSSAEPAGKLLKRNILIKDLTGKIRNGKQYIKIAIRTEEKIAD